jgi:hypothetical protein
VKNAVEALSSPKATMLFLLIFNAHDPKFTSSLAGLINDHIVLGKEGVQIIKLLGRPPARVLQENPNTKAIYST